MEERLPVSNYIVVIPVFVYVTTFASFRPIRVLVTGDSRLAAVFSTNVNEVAILGDWRNFHTSKVFFYLCMQRTFNVTINMFSNCGNI